MHKKKHNGNKKECKEKLVKNTSQKQRLNSGDKEQADMIIPEFRNQYKELERLARDELATYTHQNLKNELLPYGPRKPVKQIYKKPTLLCIPNTKLSNYLFDGECDLTGKSTLSVGTIKGKRVEVRTQIFLPMDEESDFQIPQNITAYDRVVHDGLCSVLASGNAKVTTSRQIYEAMAGKPTTSRQALERVVHSLNKMRDTTIYLDYSQHAKVNGCQIDEAIFDGKLLCFVSLKVSSNGQVVQGYEFSSPPILYQYASNVGQIVTVSKELLCIPNVTNTEDSIVLRHYLLRRIENMKSSRNNVTQNKVKFDSMFSYCGIKGNDIQIKRKRKVVYDTLQGWVNMEYIKGYRECRFGYKVVSVEISL